MLTESNCPENIVVMAMLLNIASPEQSVLSVRRHRSDGAAMADVLEMAFTEPDPIATMLSHAPVTIPIPVDIFNQWSDGADVDGEIRSAIIATGATAYVLGINLPL